VEGGKGASAEGEVDESIDKEEYEAEGDESMGKERRGADGDESIERERHEAEGNESIAMPFSADSAEKEDKAWMYEANVVSIVFCATFGIPCDVFLEVLAVSFVNFLARCRWATAGFPKGCVQCVMVHCALVWLLRAFLVYCALVWQLPEGAVVAHSAASRGRIKRLRLKTQTGSALESPNEAGEKKQMLYCALFHNIGLGLTLR
jgi:hypothetical protein